MFECALCVCVLCFFSHLIGKYRCYRFRHLLTRMPAPSMPFELIYQRPANDTVISIELSKYNLTVITKYLFLSARKSVTQRV